MAELSCPKCNATAIRGSYAGWQILVAICLFPVGLLSLLAGRQPTKCSKCGHSWQA